ncbi:hypothetical protein JSY36_08535 [Bacillus sp. H-16]|uniref:hypothetical protein n=1 Tax=Alteribacter salitolerans TaxID=2912333 RepID=UPI00196553F1|nr:hypothetical protein [Alteribacter salitolerans]MBM7095799.1 hypothetical protein [Alteribacter salitolerans]
MRRRRSSVTPFLLASFVLVAGVILLFTLIPSDARQAEKAVELFYTLEQEGKFASSWELLHSSMHNRFSRENYIQDRSHVFINHFGADSFRFILTKPKKVEDWKKHEEAEVMDVYHLTATKKYHGKYGYFEFVQYVYVTEEEGEWRILWDYNEDKGA